MDKRIIEGRCHCGNIHYELVWPASEFPITTRECSCSFCQKHGAVYTSHPQSQLLVTVENNDLLTRYRFGHETADFILCGKCGSLMFAICPLDGSDYAVTNVNNFENLTPQEMIHSVTNFDEEDIDGRLSRRKKNWTPSVTFR